MKKYVVYTIALFSLSFILLGNIEVALACTSDSECNASAGEVCKSPDASTSSTCVTGCSSDAECGSGQSCTNGGCFASSASGGSGAAEPVEFVQLQNPISDLDGASGETAVAVIIGRLILQAMTVAGSLALVAFIVGAFIWMTSAGKSDKVQQGAKTMLYAAIGLFIIFSAYGILNQIISTLT